MRNIFKHGLAALAALGAAGAWAGYAFNFPEPVTPIARETLHMHNLVMVVILVLFFLVFGLLIYSFRTHRKDAGYKAAKFTSATLFAASQVLPPPVGTRRQKYGISAGKPDSRLYGLPRPHNRSVVAVKAIDGDGSSWQALK